MEMSVRLILLSVAFVIIAGIIWDAVRNRKRKVSLANPSVGREPDLLADDDLLDEIVAVRTISTSDVTSAKVSPSASSTSLSTPITVIDRTRGDLTGKKSTTTKTTYPAQQSKMGANIDKSDIVVLHVLSKMPNIFNGSSLKRIFDELHLKFGDMNIFHSHEHVDGSGEVIFSIASAVEPGYFVMENLENLETPGLVLFFTRCHSNQSIGAFEQMYRTAKQIALRLHGEVMDEARKPLTAQKIEQYRERVKKQAFEI